MPATQDDLRTFLGHHKEVFIQVAGSGDGSPEIAWGDTFFYARKPSGEIPRMPFATIVTKDYGDFDRESNLNRGGLFRVNIEVGKMKFEELFLMKPEEFQAKRNEFNFATIDRFFPHPIYGSNGWISIVNPGHESIDEVNALLTFSLEQALARFA